MRVAQQFGRAAGVEFLSQIVSGLQYIQLQKELPLQALNSLARNILLLSPKPVLKHH